MTNVVDIPSWDDYLMAIACIVSQRSPDPATKHGAVVVDPDHRILGAGYNGFPRGGADIYPLTRPEKYKYIIHAEENCLLNCSDLTIGARIYVTGYPCSSCMKTMIQKGIVAIFYGQIGSACIDADDRDATEKMSLNHGIKLIEYEGQPTSLLGSTVEYLNDKCWCPEED